MSKKQANTNKLRLFQSEITRASNCLYALNRARQELPARDYLPLLTWALATKRKGKSSLQNLTQSLYPKKLQQLKAVPIFHEIKPEQELEWCCALILLNNTNINHFINKATEIESNLLKQNLEHCLETAGEIENDLGKSIWLIENKIAILQHIHGIESQKEYLNSIKKDGVSNIPWLASTYSQRNEETTTFFRFANQLIDFLSDLENDDQRNYLTFKSLDILPSDSTRLASILRYESNASAIDLYTTFMRIMQECISQIDHNLRDTAITCLQRLHNKIHDPKITRMLFIAGKIDCPGQEKFNNHALLEYPNDSEAQNYYNAIAESGWALAWSIAASYQAKSKIEPLSQKTLQSEVISSLRTIYEKGSGADSIISTELKRCLNFRNFQFSKALEEILWQELSSDPFHDAKKGLIRFINTQYLDPELLIHLPEVNRKPYITLIQQLYPNSKKSQALTWRSDGIPFHSADLQMENSAFRQITMAEKLLIDNNPDESISAIAELLNDEDYRHRRIAARITSKALELKGNIPDLIDFVSKQCTHDPESINLLPIPQCAEKLDKETRKQLAHKITTPITLSHYSNNYDEQFDKVLAYAYEDFLLKNGINRPSEIVKISSTLDKTLVIYYLRYICIPEIMKVSTEFNGSAAVQDERLAACSLLLKLDEQNSKEYESEIREITRAQAIRKGVRHVEQSKMSIDTTTIRKWADKKFKESFLRYKGLIKAGFNPLAGFQEALFESLSAGKPMPKEFFEVPTDEAGALLKDIVYAIIQECTISPMHGLDCYLSMRVRHGALSGQLRGPLEAERIITQKQTSQNSYAPNEYWLAQLQTLPSTMRDSININLCAFSAEYDNLIERTINQLIQIATKDKPDGIFNINFSYADLRLIAIGITEETNSDDFFDLCIDLFWRRVEACLTNVQIAIDHKLKPSINNLFRVLQESNDSACKSYSAPELNRAIRTAQTNVIQALAQLKDWFRIPSPRNEPPFEIEELIDIGLQCVQRIHKDFSPKITKEIPKLPPLADALTLFSDIFFIVFDNIRKYANKGLSPDIKIEVIRGIETITLHITNDLEESAASSEAKEKVAEIKKKINGDSYHSAVKSEGGTGLIKLRKLIGSNQELDFGYNQNKEFFVKFSLSLHEIDL